MKKIVLVLSAFVVIYFSVCVPQCDANAQVSVHPAEQVDSGTFRRVELQHLPHAVLRTMGTSGVYEDCTFEGAYVKGPACAPQYKILVQKADRTEMSVYMNGKGEVTE